MKLASSTSLLVLAASGAWLANVEGQSPPAIPNLAGQVLTVTGPIPPDQLGHTLTHEHLFIDFTSPDDQPAKWTMAGRTKPVGATDVAFYNAPLTMEMTAAVMLGKPNRDNWLLNDEALAIREVAEFKRRGGGSIVDVTSIGLRRNPEGLRRIARATGVNIVMGASWYQKAWHPADMDDRTVESLTAEIVRDVTVGVGDTGIRAGVIGEVGTTGNPLTGNELKVIRASGRASRITGAPISLHTSAALKEQPKILDLLAEEGADLSRVIVGHSDPIANDVPFLTELLKRGVYIQFDLLGRPPLVTRRRPTDAEVAAAILALVKAGHGERLLLSHDICTKTSLKAYGGTGYSFIEEMFVPYLKRQGATDAQIAAMIVDNPRRVFTFAAPQPPRSGSRTSGPAGGVR
jgi:phosphotriesterase-related protein